MTSGLAIVSQFRSSNAKARFEESKHHIKDHKPGHLSPSTSLGVCGMCIDRLRSSVLAKTTQKRKKIRLLVCETEVQQEREGQLYAHSVMSQVFRKSPLCEMSCVCLGVTVCPLELGEVIGLYIAWCSMRFHQEIGNTLKTQESTT